MPVYVQHQILRRIPDVFNAEALWQAPGLALFSRRPLLRDLLERCPREHRGRAATRCFSHITLALPQEEVDDDYHLSRGARARDLVQSLTSLHQKDFADLLAGETVRYDVVGTDTLGAGEVEVRFGHAVYLPAPDEKILYNVSLSRDSAVWHPVCPIYPAQRLVLIGAAGSDASHTSEHWPFGPDASLLILNDGPDAPPVVQMRPKEGYQCNYDPRSGYYIIRTLPEVAGGTRLLLKISRSASAAPRSRLATTPSAQPGVAAATTISHNATTDTRVNTAGSAPQTRPAVWQERHGGTPSRSQASAANGMAAVNNLSSAADVTAIPSSRRSSSADIESDATYAPASSQRVSLVALALPRLSRYRETGMQTLALPFNRQMALAPNADAVISFMVTSNDELYAASAEGRQRISAPSTFTPVDGYSIALIPAAPAMADRYCALLGLARPLASPAPAGARFNFGRNSPVLAGLRILGEARYLQRASGDSAAGVERIGLSRNAFSFEATARGFLIVRLNATQALYHLDDKLAFVAAIENASEAPYLLPGGHHLVAGPYVLRFDA
ncbi:hypothetical protein [Duganella qianjiadongensis]|uniref:Uncharacterized protein n=1 Tax=Duganella qianjiadongensis TaxID=2692176 RepID=A0ABW9VGF5_9BURK|nr:hypothetical protein [Duganella qianjiadongensis]MYM37750.1 hypothetical protein [Duganella qianjiadongensis]